MIVCCAAPAVLRAEVTESKVKAVFLYNFLNYITWPEKSLSDGMKTICLFVEDEDVLDTLKFIQARDSGFAIEKREGNELEGCHIAYEDYLYKGDAADFRQLAARENNILRVSSNANFIKEYLGIVEFFQLNRGIKIRIDARRLQETGLRASSKLLSISDVVNR